MAGDGPSDLGVVGGEGECCLNRADRSAVEPGSKLAEDDRTSAGEADCRMQHAYLTPPPAETAAGQSFVHSALVDLRCRAVSTAAIQADVDGDQTSLAQLG